MFKIYDGRDKFYQWDLNRKLIVIDSSITEVHFCNRTDNCSLVCNTYSENGLTLVDVPNLLLQTDWKIHVYAYIGYTKYDTCFEVVGRTKPADYVYTEVEIKNYDELDKRVKALEQGGGSTVIAEESRELVYISDDGLFSLFDNELSYKQYTLNEFFVLINEKLGEEVFAEDMNLSMLLALIQEKFDFLRLQGNLTKGVSFTPLYLRSEGNDAFVWHGTFTQVNENGALETIAFKGVPNIEADRVDWIEEGKTNIGDVETALDSIIAIQNSLIGGEEA